MRKRFSKIKDLSKNWSFWQKAMAVPGLLFTLVMAILTFFEVSYNKFLFFALVIVSIIYIIRYFIVTSGLKEITLNVDGSLIEITSGDIFEQDDCYKVIAFNEFFDTKVDDKIISSKSLNGIYLLNKYPTAREINSFDKRVAKEPRLKAIEEGVSRRLGGKTARYELGSIFQDKDYFLVAFSKFDEKNEANLRLAEYATCLLRFWDEANSLYNQNPIALPLLGTGITRHKDFTATNQELLEVILWTFKISKVKFKEPSKVKILIRENQIEDIDFNKLREFENNSI
ncbi:macro domain-containing protein [Peribacillus sp. NPDC058075]|uniref:macro domain-containing protein n=1 Tax=unclassified Peribacillus TaxID=2675266 RepID=UPI0036DABB32